MTYSLLFLNPPSLSNSQRRRRIASVARPPQNAATVTSSSSRSKPHSAFVKGRGSRNTLTMDDQEEFVTNPSSKCADESTRKGKNKKKRLPKDNVGSEEEQGGFSLVDPESNNGVKGSRKKKERKKSLDSTAADADNAQLINGMRSLEEGNSDIDTGKAENGRKRKKKRLLEEAEKAEKRGVCYLSRIPPRMDHVKLRQILSQYGKIQRIYLVPEDPSVQVRKRAARFESQGFSEGWVEFTKKTVAKRVANMLNGEQVGGRKRSSFYYDLWNIKYLSKFKWDDLTEEIAYKSAVREQKLALEVSAARRERDFYLSKVDKSRALRSIDERMKKKQKVQQESGNKSELSVNEQPMKVIRQFQQKQPVVDKASENKPRLSRDILAGVFR